MHVMVSVLEGCSSSHFKYQHQHLPVANKNSRSVWING